MRTFRKRFECTKRVSWLVETYFLSRDKYKFIPVLNAMKTYLLLN